MPKLRKRLVSQVRAEQVRRDRVDHFTNLEGTSECYIASLWQSDLANCHFSVTETLDSFPSEFVGIRTDGKTVRKLANELYPELTGPWPPPSYTVIPEDGRYLVRLSRKARRKLPKDHPPYVIIRAVQVVPEDVQDSLVALWLRMNALGVKFPAAKRDNRSSTPALHTGVWHLSSPNPMVSVDTRQEDPVVRELLEEFLSIVRVRIAPTIRRLIALYCPKLLEKQDRCVPCMV